MILYHVTKDNNIDIFKPSLSSKTMPSEDKTIPRISAADTIDGCFRGLNIDIDKIKKIHKPVRYYVYQLNIEKTTKIHKPSIEQVPDVYKTGEYWILSPVTGIIIGYVDVSYDSNNDKLIFDDHIQKTKHDVSDLIMLNKKLNNFQYGIIDRNKLIRSSVSNLLKYRVAAPSIFERLRGGICWDFVVYQEKILRGIYGNDNVSTHCIVFDNKSDVPTHTFTVVKLSGKYYWTESAFYAMQGVYAFNSLTDLINTVALKMIQYQGQIKPAISIRTEVYSGIIDCTNPALIGMNMNEFMQEMFRVVSPIKVSLSKPFSYQVIYRPRTSIKSDKELSIMVKEIIKAIPKSEHHLFCNKSEYKDSPYTKYRDAVYIGNGGAFIDIYSIDDDTIGNVVIAASPEARGTGVTDNLIQRAIVACKELGMRELQWRCSRYNIHSMRTAERNYFVMDRKKSTKKEVVYKYKLI